MERSSRARGSLLGQVSSSTLTRIALVIFALLSVCACGFYVSDDEILFRIHEPSSVSYVYRAASSKRFGGVFEEFLDHVPLVGATPDDGCSPLTNRRRIQGNVALIIRGNCQFWHKCYHAQQAGARAVMIYDNDESNVSSWVDMLLQTEEGNDHPITIPALFVLGRDGHNIAAALRTAPRHYAVLSMPINETAVLTHQYAPFSIWA